MMKWPSGKVTPGAGEVAALHHDQRIGVGVAARGDLDPVDAGELPIVVGRGVGIDQPHVFAQRLERVGHRQLRADRVAVRARVRRQQEPLPAQQRLADRANDIRRPVPPAG